MKEEDETNKFINNKSIKGYPIPVRNKGFFTKLEKIGDKIFNILRWIETKLFAFGSIALAVFLIYYSNFFKILFEHPAVDSLYFYISIFLYCTCLFLMLYLVMYLNESQWEDSGLIPLIASAGFGGMLSLIASIWNIFGWYSLPLVIIIKWGFIMTSHFAPGGRIGTVLFFIIIILALFSGYFIEHDGYLH